MNYNEIFFCGVEEKSAKYFPFDDERTSKTDSDKIKIQLDISLEIKK